jgi:hypothetical protein
MCKVTQIHHAVSLSLSLRTPDPRPSNNNYVQRRSEDLPQGPRFITGPSNVWTKGKNRRPENLFFFFSLPPYSLSPGKKHCDVCLHLQNLCARASRYRLSKTPMVSPGAMTNMFPQNAVNAGGLSVNMDRVGAVVLGSRLLQCRTREPVDTRMGVTGLGTDGNLERGCRGCNKFVQFTSVAIASVVDVVGALVRPHAAADGTCDANCHANDGADSNQCNQNADGQSLALAVAGPVVLECAATTSTGGTTLLLVLKTSLSQGLVCGPHGAFLLVAADGEFLAERVLIVVVASAGVRCNVAVLEVLLGSEVGGLCGSLVDALVGGRWVGVKRGVWWERSVV